jgi:hypothetical protein
LMRNNNNKNNNDNHILTPTERAFYQRLATEGTQKIDECWKITNNPDQQEEGCKIAAFHMPLDGNVQIAEMLEHETTV